jgi:hypothetical protein
MLWGAVIAVVLVVVGGLIVRSHQHPTPIQMASNASSFPIVSQTVDLSSAASTRGTSNQQSLATLPKRTVKLTLILPVLSETGSYAVGVNKVQAGSKADVSGRGMAFHKGQQTVLEATLHLEDLDPGLYYLSTTHESDEVVYYYPFKIVP